MQAVVVKVSIDRKTGRQISEEIISHEKVDEDVFYRPLIEIIGERVLAACRDEMKRGRGRIYHNHTREEVKEECRDAVITSIKVPDALRV